MDRPLGLKSSASSRPESRSGASRPLSSSRSRPISSSSSSMSRPASRGINMPGANFLDGGRGSERGADANSSPRPNQPKFKPSYVHEVRARPSKSQIHSKAFRVRARTRSAIPYFTTAISFFVPLAWQSLIISTSVVHSKALEWSPRGVAALS